LRNRLIVAVCGAALCVAAAAGSGLGKTSASATKCDKSKPPFTVLFLGDLTGPIAVTGKAQLLGIKTASAYLNANRGGMNGSCIKMLDPQSSNGDAATAASVLLRYLSSNDKPDLVWPGTVSAEQVAALPITTRNGLLSVITTAPNDALLHNASANYPYAFAMQPSQDAKGPQQAVIDWLKTRHVRGKVGILQQDYPLGPIRSKVYADLLQSAGLTSVLKTYPNDALDVTPQVSALKDAGVSAVINVGNGPPLAYGLTARYKLGMTRPWLVHIPGVDLGQLVPASQRKGAWMIVQRALMLAPSSLPVKTFLRVSAQFGGFGDGQSILVAGYAWDAMFMINHAAAQAKSTSRDALVDALEQLKSQTDPMYLNYSKVGGFSKDSHENLAGDTKAAFGVRKITPFKNGLLAPAG
jgi:branched-chain amino acid transport system substrate-binding protein